MQSPVFLVNSRLCLVSATTLSLHHGWHPFSLSYGVILQSSLTIVLPLTLASSASPPVSVSGTGARGLLRSFSWQSSVNAFVVISDNSHSGLTYKQGDLPPRPGFALRPAIPSAGAPSFLRHSIVKQPLRGTGLATCCPSATPLGLTLGPALPWADQPSPGTLGLPVSVILTHFALLMPAFSLVCSPHTLPGVLHPTYNAPLPIRLLKVNLQASVSCLAPSIFGATILDQ